MMCTDLSADLAECNLVTVDHFVPIPVCRRMLREASVMDWVPSGVAVMPGRQRSGAPYAAGRSSFTLAADQHSPWMEAALRRIERTLVRTFGIRSRNLEPWQLTRYKRGDAFDYHLDCGCWGRHPSGERRRTILVYLEQPVRGGATDFRALHRKISPIRGRLAVWNNLLPNGNCNHAMIHAGRPVWQGRKSILTTWERERCYVR